MKHTRSTTGKIDSGDKRSDSKENFKMSERENEEQMIDPPENQGGGGKAEMDSPAEESAAIDPPSNDGGH